MITLCLLLAAAATATTPVAPRNTYEETVVAEGPQWTQVRATGYDENGRYFSNEFYKIRGPAGLLAAPLPLVLQQDLSRSVPNDDTTILVSKLFVDYWPRPGCNPFTGKCDDPDEWPGVDPFGKPRKNSLLASGQRTCPDIAATRTLSIDHRVVLDNHFDQEGFEGVLDVAGSVEFKGTATVNFSDHAIESPSDPDWCAPYATIFGKLDVEGTAIIDLNAALSGTIRENKKWEHLVIEPLEQVTIPVGEDLIANVGLDMPITLGLDLTRTAVGSVSFNAQRRVTSAFHYLCDTNGQCSASGNPSFSSAPTQAQVPTGSVSGRLLPSVFAEVAVRGHLQSLVADDYVQVGFRSWLRGDLWGYSGNTCGDGDGDGVSETVNALTFDLDTEVELNGASGHALVEGGASETKLWSIRNFGRQHSQFWDLAAPASMAPQFFGATRLPNTSITAPVPSFGAKMRSCWPYADNVTYRFDWGDNTFTSVTGAPQTITSPTHAYATNGAKTLTLTAQRDGHGRLFTGRTTSRAIQVGPGSALEMRCYKTGSTSGCGLAGFWSAAGGPFNFVYTAADPAFRIYYPYYGTFPYATNNSVIYFGIPTGATNFCPTGAQISMSASTTTQSLGTVSAICP